MDRTFKATVTLNKTQLAELVIWAVKNKCSGGLTFGADIDGDIVPVEVSITAEEARAAIEANLPPSMGARERRQRMAHRQEVLAASDSRYILDDRGRVCIDASCRAMGLSRKELVARRWKSGSAEHRVKCAIFKETPKQTAKPLVLTPTGAIDIEESLLSLGLSRDTLLRKRWKQNSNPHKVKAAIRCGWKAAQKAKRERAISRAHSSRYSTNGNIMGKSGMKAKGLKDMSQVV